MSLQLVTKGVLKAPEGFWRMHPKTYKRVCNGAGPKGWGWLIPDTMWGLRITKAADIHDFMYYWGIWPKDFCDKLFYENLVSLINNKGGALKYLRRARAYTYYKAVHFFGASSFKRN
jgi:hypothetical protein